MHHGEFRDLIANSYEHRKKAASTISDEEERYNVCVSAISEVTQGVGGETAADVPPKWGMGKFNFDIIC